MKNPFTGASGSNERTSKLAKGVFCDVDGTLVGILDGKLNEPLVKALQMLMDKRVPVYIITGGDTDVKAIKLQKLGVRGNLLAVRRKDDFAAYDLQVLIDDTDPKEQFLSVYGQWFKPRVTNVEEFVSDIMRVLEETAQGPKPPEGTAPSTPKP